MLVNDYILARIFLNAISCLRGFKIGEVVLATTSLVVLRLTHINLNYSSHSWEI